MTSRAVLYVALALAGSVVALSYACVSDPGSGARCLTGSAVACVGSGGCAGGQTCAADGTFGPCVCGDQPDAGLDGNVSDTSVVTDSALAVDANDFLPSKVPGLVAWYNGDIGLTLEAGVVTGWADQSPSQNDLSVFNDTGSNTDIKRNTLALNGHDVVTFSTGSLNNQTATGVDYGSLDFLVEVVARVTGCIGPCYLAVTGAPSGNALSGLLGVEADGGFIVRARHGLYPAIGPRIPFGEVHIFGAHENAGTLELRIDGKVVTTADAGTVTPVPRGIYLAGVGTSYAYGDIAEAIVVKAPSTTATTFVETYLRAKYGFK